MALPSGRDTRYHMCQILHTETGERNALQNGWRIREGSLIPDPNLSHILQGQNINDVKALGFCKLKLEQLNPMDVLEMTAVQFFLRAEPAQGNK